MAVGRSNIWIKQTVLTAANNDASAPRLSDVQALSLFEKLEERKLIVSGQQGQLGQAPGTTAYLINEFREREWRAFIRSLSTPWRVIHCLWRIVLWGGSIGGAWFITEKAKD